jgi:hypothetical protein
MMRIETATPPNMKSLLLALKDLSSDLKHADLCATQEGTLEEARRIYGATRENMTKLLLWLSYFDRSRLDQEAIGKIDNMRRFAMELNGNLFTKLLRLRVRIALRFLKGRR